MQDAVARGLREAQQQADAAGVHMQQLMVAPEELHQIVEALRSKPWDAVLIGNGVRSSLELTPYLEQLVAAVREHAPQAVVMFNTTPLTCMDAIRRWFPAVAGT